MKNKIGAFVGKFYPPHIGHLSIIDDMSKKLDEVWIIISYNETRNKEIMDSANFNKISPLLIKKWFVRHYKNNNKIKVAIFNEKNFLPYPQDREKWATAFKKKFPTINAKIADESYREYNEKYFPEYEFIPIDRNIVNIHSTQIRKNIAKNINYIIPEAKRYFERRENAK